MNYSFHPEAELEFTKAIDYYEDKEAGLGYDFAMEVYSAIERIKSAPKLAKRGVISPLVKVHYPSIVAVKIYTLIY